MVVAAMISHAKKSSSNLSQDIFLLSDCDATGSCRFNLSQFLTQMINIPRTYIIYVNVKLRTKEEDTCGPV
jgi:hypothetical protein